jgi:hypothetical protein
VLEPYCGTGPYEHAGRRVVEAAGDMFLGWATGAGEHGLHFYFRQLSDAKIKPVVELMKPQASTLSNYAAGITSASMDLSLHSIRSRDYTSKRRVRCKSREFICALPTCRSLWRVAEQAVLGRKP